MNVQQHIRNGVSLLTRDQIIQQIAVCDTLLECDANDIEQLGFTKQDIKSLKSKMISRLKTLDSEMKKPGL